nr:hypothetical protein [Mycobacterium gordonae]
MVDYWHGSCAALPVGTRLEPLRQIKGSAFTSRQYQHLINNNHDPDRVYFTTDLQLARAWCMRSKDSALLLVEPEGPVAPDPDYPGTSFSASQAVVRDVIEHPVTMKLLAARKAFAEYEPPESYDEKGFIRPDVRLSEIFAASSAPVERFHKIGGRYPNPQRFSLRDRQIRYITDDLELLVTNKLLIEHSGRVSEQYFQTCLNAARASWPVMKPIPWQ